MQPRVTQVGSGGPGDGRAPGQFAPAGAPWGAADTRTASPGRKLACKPWRTHADRGVSSARTERRVPAAGRRRGGAGAGAGDGPGLRAGARRGEMKGGLRGRGCAG